jgi:hypothetical protein
MDNALDYKPFIGENVCDNGAHSRTVYWGYLLELPGFLDHKTSAEKPSILDIPIEDNLQVLSIRWKFEMRTSFPEILCKFTLDLSSL